MKFLQLALVLFLAFPLLSQHQSSIGIQLGLDAISPVKAFGNIQSGPGNGEIRKEQRLHYNVGATYSVRIFPNSMLATGINYNAYGHNINYYDLVGFEDREVYYENRYLTVPMIYKHEMWFKRFSLYVETGALLNFYLNTKYVNSEFDINSVERSTDLVNDGRLKFGFHVGIGIQFDLSKRLQFFINPTYRLFPHDNSVAAVQGYKSFGVNVGVRRAVSLTEKSE